MNLTQRRKARKVCADKMLKLQWCRWVVTLNRHRRCIQRRRLRGRNCTSWHVAVNKPCEHLFTFRLKHSTCCQVTIRFRASIKTEPRICGCASSVPPELMFARLRKISGDGSQWEATSPSC